MKMHRGKRVLFIYCNWEREHTIIDLIVKRIKYLKKDHACFRIGMHDKDCIRKILKVKPDVVITYTIKNEIQIEICKLIKFCFNSLIITFETEGLADFENPDSVKLSAGLYEYPASLIDYHVFWGRKAANRIGNRLLQDNKIKSWSQIKVYGNPMYEIDEIQKMYQTNQVVRRLHKQSKKYKETVVFLTGFHTSLYTLQNFIIAQDVVSIKSREKEDIIKDPILKKFIDFRDNEIIYADQYMDVIRSAAQKYKDILFIVKLHPCEIMRLKKRDKIPYLNKIDNISNVFIINESIPLGCILTNCSLMIHYGSTADLESYIYHVPSLKLEYESKNDLMIESVRLTESTYYENISEAKDKIGFYMEQILKGKDLFIQNSEKEKQLFNLMNYKNKETYMPSVNLAELICSSIKTHRMVLKKQEIKEIIKIIYRTKLNRQRR